MTDIIPVIDLFAGPGGLGEGFATFKPAGRKRYPFKIKVSIEMDEHAHRTLELRSFYRQFLGRQAPAEYYRYMQEAGTRKTPAQAERARNDLYARYPREASAARKEARRATLGDPEDDKKVYGYIHQALEGRQDRPWVLIGGPPCQAYSIIGRGRRRAAGAGRAEYERDKRHFLYKEYLRIMGEFRPPVFVMENVKGILSSKVNGENIFERILTDLRKPLVALAGEGEAPDNQTEAQAENRLEYVIYSPVVQKDDPADLEPEDFVIRSEEYGIPQARHRVILLGIRHDLDVRPQTLLRQELDIAARSVLSDLPPIRSALSREKDSPQRWRAVIRAIRCERWFQELPSSDPVKVEVMRVVGNARDDLEVGNEFMWWQTGPEYRPDWYCDPALGGVCNHTARAHMHRDLYRYLYASCFARVYGRSPMLRDFPQALWPDHENVRHYRNGQKPVDGKIAFDDRFRVQLADRPAATITSHMAKDGHYSIHYEPSRCRSLTVREAARLQTFPDNYFFEGPMTQQFRQVGNAVPPLLAHQIARVIYALCEQIHAA